MSKPTLAKNSKTVKLPRQSGSVAAALERAASHAKKHKWTKVIIIGEGPEGGNWFHSFMQGHTMIGMMENAKYIMYKDFYG